MQQLEEGVFLLMDCRTARALPAAFPMITKFYVLKITKRKKLNGEPNWAKRKLIFVETIRFLLDSLKIVNDSRQQIFAIESNFCESFLW